jgi:hypothetical protein
MKNIILTALTMVLLTGCYDREVIDHKEFNHFLPPVEELIHTMVGTKIVRLTWEYPEDVSEDFMTPLEVNIQVVENGIYKQIVIVDDGKNTKNITINPDNKYKFIVRLMGVLTEDAKETGKTDRVFSESVFYEVDFTTAE